MATACVQRRVGATRGQVRSPTRQSSSLSSSNALNRTASGKQLSPTEITLYNDQGHTLPATDDLLFDPNPLTLADRLRAE